MSTRLGSPLDLHSTNRPGLLKYPTTIPGISDHHIIVVDAALQPEFITKQPRRVYFYSKANWEAIRREIEEFTEEYIDNSYSTDINWMKCKDQEHLESIINKHNFYQQTSIPTMYQ